MFFFRSKEKETSVKVILLNIQSIRNNVEELLLLLENTFPNIIVITEDWLKPAELIFLPQHIFCCKFCRERSIHGDTLILVEKNLRRNFTKIEKYYHLLMEGESEFSITCCAQLNLFVLCIYRSSCL